MAEFTIKGNNYRSGKMDAIKQSHIARRIAPVFGSIQDAFAAAGKPESFTMLDALPIMTKIVGEMSDANWEYIVLSCLDVTARQQGQVWAKIRAGGRMMFEDIQLPEMMQIVWSVLNDNLANFFFASLQASPKDPAA
jgi:hypothetical protein